MAETYTLRFNKAPAKTVVRIIDDDDAILYADTSSDSPMTDMLKNLSLKLDNVKTDLENQTRKNTDIETKFETMGHGMYTIIGNMKEEIEQMAQAVEATQKKLEDIEETLSKLAADLHNTKTNVSLMFRSRK